MMNTGNPPAVELVKTLYTADAMVLPPNAPATNDLAAVAQSWTAPGGVAKNLTFSNVVIHGQGDVAYSQGSWEGDFALPGGGSMHDKGKFLDTWKKETDGSWKSAHTIWNSDMPAGFAMPTGTMKADAAPEAKAMNDFAGAWKLDADMMASPLGPAGKGTTVMDCRWLMNGLTLMCRNEGTMPAGSYQEVFLMSYDAEAKAYTAYDVDNAGVMAPVGISRKDGAWTFSWDLKMGGKPLKVRASFDFAGPDAWTLRQEFSTGGAWAPLQEARASRIGM
jgi:ketosteroid isomerase-like protein